MRAAGARQPGPGRWPVGKSRGIQPTMSAMPDYESMSTVQLKTW